LKKGINGEFSQETARIIIAQKSSDEEKSDLHRIANDTNLVRKII
jgi:hypothetical protein